MEDLFREILASPSVPSTSLTLDSVPPAIYQAQVAEESTTMATTSTASSMTTETHLDMDWISQAEIQRLLDILPDVQTDVNPTVETIEFPSALDLGLGGTGWEVENISSIGVF
jgi:hypothetical protein